MLGIAPEKSPLKALKNFFGLMFFLLCISLVLGGGIEKIFTYLLPARIGQFYSQQTSTVKDPEVVRAVFDLYNKTVQDQQRVDQEEEYEEEPEEEECVEEDQGFSSAPGGVFVGGIKRY